MIAAIKITLSFLMSILNIISFVFFGNFAGDYSPKKDDCKLNFAVISDVHMTDETARRDMLELGLYDMENADAPLDALVISGDMTDHARTDEYNMLAEAFSKYTPAKNIILAVGNHDTWNNEVEDEFEYAKSKELFIEYNKKIANRDIDNVYYSTVINGYTFIMMSSEDCHTDAYISDSQLKWLDRELAKATKDGKPVFVVSHWPFNQTHGLPLTWLDQPLIQDKSDLEPDEGGFGNESDKIAEILNKYKNVFLLSGHLHNGVADNSMYGYSSIEKHGSVTSVNLPSYMYVGVKGAPSNGLGYQIEVYDNEVVIRARCFTAGVWYTQNEYTATLENNETK